MKLKIFSLTIIIFLQAFPIFAQEQVQLWVTKDLGQEILFEKNVPIYSKKDSVMDILKRHTQVQTSMGGAFVVGINGRISQDIGGKKDWLYYVNGRLASVGALAYFPKPNDIIWWDYHRWDNAVYVSSVIGAYPQPFVNATETPALKTIIFATQSAERSGKILKEALQQKGVIPIELWEENLQRIPEEFDTHFILIGPWNEIAQDPKVQEVIKNYNKAGFFIKIDESGLQALDILGKPVKTFPHASAILAIGSGFQQTPAFWIITGTDATETDQAVNLLVSESERIKFHSGIVFSNNEVINVPVVKK